MESAGSRWRTVAIFIVSRRFSPVARRSRPPISFRWYNEIGGGLSRELGRPTKIPKRRQFKYETTPHPIAGSRRSEPERQPGGCHPGKPRGRPLSPDRTGCQGDRHGRVVRRHRRRRHGELLQPGGAGWTDDEGGSASRTRSGFPPLASTTCHTSFSPTPNQWRVGATSV